MLLNPLIQLSHLLSPMGIKTVTTGNAAAQAFLEQRYGTHDSQKLPSIFQRELEGIPQAKVVVLGIPNDNGAGFERGSKMGPMAIRQALMQDSQCYTRWKEQGVLDIGDVLDHPLLIDDALLNSKTIHEVRQSRWGKLGDELDLPVSAQSIAKRVLQCLYTLNPSLRILILGGDHSHSIVPVQALCDHLPSTDSFGILIVDAHTDLLKVRDGLSTSYACWAYHANNAIGRGKKMVQVGIRTSGSHRNHWEEGLEIRQIWSHEVNSNTIPTVLQHFRDAGVNNLYLSTDIDGLSPEYAAATGTPEPNGLEPRFVHELIDAVGEHFSLLGSDLMEVAPPLSRRVPEEPQRTLDEAVKLVHKQIQAMLKGTR